MPAFRFNNNEITRSVKALVERTKVGILLRPQESAELSNDEKEPRAAIEERINPEAGENLRGHLFGQHKQRLYEYLSIGSGW